jgi:beta-glucosidase
LLTLHSSQFGKNFLWGVAISAAQNEGAYNVDGRGLSIWDVFVKKSGKIKGNAKPYDTCNFYYLYKQDLLLAKALGFKVFRFSIAWSRIFPDGKGKVNKLGVAFYHQLIEECLLLDLIPMVTLYHWDLPYELEKDGGFTSRLFSKWFEKYVDFCTQEFGSKVKYWLVLNEPMGFTSLGYMLGKHAPGKVGINNFFAAVLNATLAQADGGHIIRANVSHAHIGTTFSCSEVMPYTQKKEDIEAANKMDILLNRLFIEPTLGRNYPHDNFVLMDKLHLYTKAWKYTDRFKFNFNFIGLQNYFAVTVKHNSLIPYVNASEVKASTRKVPHTDMGWEINADSFYRIIKRYWHYGNVKEIMITENGAFFKDKLVKASVNDVQRIQYFDAYLRAALKAKQEGVKLTGYLAWTLTDNFEWAEGYHAKFGLIHIDFKTQKRTIKESGYWWRNFLST